MGNNKNYSNKKSSNHSHNNKKKGSLISNVNNQRMNKQDIKNKLNDGILVYNGALTVTELAEKLGLTPVEIVRSLFLEKIMVNVNTTLNDDYIELVALKYGYEPLEIDGIRKVINGTTNMKELNKKLLID